MKRRAERKSGQQAEILPNASARTIWRRSVFATHYRFGLFCLAFSGPA